MNEGKGEEVVVAMVAGVAVAVIVIVMIGVVRVCTPPLPLCPGWP